MKKTPIALILMGLLLTFINPFHASAQEAPITSYTTSYAFLNCNDAIYNKGVMTNGFDLTWATGSGTTRKYIRAQRMANLFKTQPNLSLIALTECSTEMLTDLKKLLGSNWKSLGGDPTAHNKNAWLYDSNKWYPGNLSVTNLPGSQGRRLLQVGWYLKVDGVDPMLSTATTHLSSADPDSRNEQMDAAIAKIGGATRLLTGDLNASSYPQDGDNACSRMDPRWNLQCKGWSDYGHQVPSFHNYGKTDPALPIDYIGVSPAARDNGKIVLSNTRVVDTLPSYAADHRLLIGDVTFN